MIWAGSEYFWNMLLDKRMGFKYLHTKLPGEAWTTTTQTPQNSSATKTATGKTQHRPCKKKFWVLGWHWGDTELTAEKAKMEKCL